MAKPSDARASLAVLTNDGVLLQELFILPPLDIRQIFHHDVTCQAHVAIVSPIKAEMLLFGAIAAVPTKSIQLVQQLIRPKCMLGAWDCKRNFSILKSV